MGVNTMSQGSNEIEASFEQGLMHFNSQEFVDAHELWQEALESGELNGEQKQFLQALQGLADAFHRIREGLDEGVVKTMQVSSRSLARLPGKLLDVDVGSLVKAVDNCRREFMSPWADYEEEFPDEHFPRIELDKEVGEDAVAH